jgi:hypothetical protein
MNIISFTSVTSDYGWLGNMYAAPICFNNECFRTSEALFQAMRFNDPEIKEVIRNEKSPMAAKMKAKFYQRQRVVVPMSQQDVNNMKNCLTLKFTQHEELKKKLLSTGNTQIIENIGNRNGERHRFWGMKQTEQGWIGTNMMGKLLMEVREELKSTTV